MHFDYDNNALMSPTREINRLMGAKHETKGTFVTGKSVPKSRPTMFWEAQSRDLNFDFDDYQDKKDWRTAKHKE